MLVEIPKQPQAAVLMSLRTIFIFSVKARDKVINEFGGGGIVAGQNETGRNMIAVFLPEIVGFFIVPVEGFQSSKGSAQYVCLFDAFRWGRLGSSQ